MVDLRFLSMHRAVGRLGWVCFTAIVLVACGGSPKPVGGSCTLGLPAGAGDDAAIRAVLQGEGELMVAQDIDKLMALWDDGSYVSDAKHTPDESTDDQFWRDKDAIRHRYVRTVFPGAPKTATPADLKIALDGDHAVVIATTHIGGELAPAGDRWTLNRHDGCWYIESLTYNLEPQ